MSVPTTLFAFVDTGAVSCLSEEIVRRLSIPTSYLPDPITFYLATGTPVLVSRFATLNIAVAGWTGQWTFLVLPLVFDAFLGMDWLTAVKGSLCADKAVLTVEGVSTRLIAHPGRGRDPSPQLAAVVQLPLPPPATELPAEYSAYSSLLNADRDRAELPPDVSQFACRIKLHPDAVLGYCRLRPTTQEELAWLWDYVQKAKSSKWIRPSSSRTSAQMLFVRKSDGSLRGVVDYRRLNDATIKDRYPLPLQSDLFDRLRKAKRLTKIDLTNAYHLLPMHPDDCHLTAFATPFGLFEYVVMAQGLCNAPATFMRFIRHVIGECEYRQAIVYMDDILIFSEDPATHQRDVEEVLRRLDRYKLTVKLSKCYFNVDVVDFLGFRISHLGFSVDPVRVASVAALPAPQSVKGVQRFLGFMNHARRFIPRFADIASCLHALTKKNVRFEWNAPHQEAFDCLKMALMEAPVLAHPQFDAPFIVEVDASEVAIGGILLQRDSDSEPRAVAYFSRILTPAERNYPVADKELLSLYAAFKTWRHYLEGAKEPITVRTDNRSVMAFRTKTISNFRHARWAVFFERFHFSLERVAGSDNRSDYLTRCYELPVGSPSENDQPIIKEPPPRVLASLTSPNLDWMARVVLAQVSHPHKDAPRSDDGIAYKDGRLYIPTKDLQAVVLQRLHGSALAGHCGYDKTLARVREECWWPSMPSDVKDYVAKCDTCQRSKNRTHRPYGLLCPVQAPRRPWDSISLDFLSDLPRSQGHSGVLVIVDRFSKMVEFVPTAGSLTAAQTADAVFSSVVCRYGFPTSVVSDRGPQFSSAFWGRFLELGGATGNLSTANHPQTDGQSERAIQALQQYLRMFCSFHQRDWSSLLPMAASAYNTSWHFGLRSTPARAVLGYQPKTHFLTPTTTSSPAAEAYARERTSIWENLHDNLLAAQERMKRTSDRRRTAAPPLAEGSWVLLSTEHLRLPQPNRKLAARRIGPFKVVAMIGPNACRLELPDAYAIHPVVNVTQLEPYNGSPPQPTESPCPLPTKEVHSILTSKRNRKRLFYLVRWVGMDASADSWEAASHMTSIAPEMVSRFEESRVAPK